MTPKANGCIPSCRTRYIGRMLATISDDTSVSRLVKPSAQTVGLTAGIRLRRPATGSVAGAVEPSGRARAARDRENRLVQSMAYMGRRPSGKPLASSGLHIAAVSRGISEEVSSHPDFNPTTVAVSADDNR